MISGRIDGRAAACLPFEERLRGTPTNTLTYTQAPNVIDYVADILTRLLRMRGDGFTGSRTSWPMFETKIRVFGHRVVAIQTD